MSLWCYRTNGMSMNGDFWNYLYLWHAEGRMWIYYSIDRTIKKLSEVHLTFIINYFELRDEVIKNRVFMSKSMTTCMWWAMKRPILHLNPETCMCSYCFILAIPYNVSSTMVEKNINFQEWRTIGVLSWKFYLNEKTSAQVSSFYDLYWREDL